MITVLIYLLVSQLEPSLLDTPFVWPALGVLALQDLALIDRLRKGNKND